MTTVLCPGAGVPPLLGRGGAIAGDRGPPRGKSALGDEKNKFNEWPEICVQSTQIVSLVGPPRGESALDSRGNKFLKYQRSGKKVFCHEFKSTLSL